MSLGDRYNEFYRHQVRHDWTDIRATRWPRNRTEAALSVPGTGQRILDIGCGDGFLLWQFRHRFRELLGLEIANTRLTQAVANLDGLPFRGLLGSAEHIENVETESVDRVVSVDSIEHIPDVYAAMSEFHRVLRPGGLLVVNTPNIAFVKKRVLLLFGRFPSTSQRNEGFGSDVLFDGGHLHYFTFRSLHILIERSGLEVVRAMGYGPFGIFNSVARGLLSPGVQWVARKK